MAVDRMDDAMPEMIRLINSNVRFWSEMECAMGFNAPLFENF
jgi:hypothetical protein